MRTSKTAFLMFCFVLVTLLSCLAQTAATAHAGLPYPNAATPKAIDLGALTAQSRTTPISITIALRLPELNNAENLLKSLHTPGNPQLHQFLTAKQFLARFAPSDADIANVLAALARYGLTAQRSTATTLQQLAFGN
jgi:subtilase family serine protease